MDLALNNLQWLICHAIKPNPNKQKLKGDPFFWSLLFRKLSVTIDFCTRGIKHGVVTKEESRRSEEKHIGKKYITVKQQSRYG